MDIFEAARAALPAWVGWGTAIFYLPAALLLSTVGSLLVAFLASIPLRRLRGRGHWTERARLAMPVRVASLMAMLTMPVLVGGLAVLYDGPLARLHWTELALWAALAAFVPGFVVRQRVERLFYDAPPTFLTRVKSTITVWLVLIPHLFVAILMLVLLPTELNLAAALVLAGGMAAFTFFALGGGLFLARAVGLARPASERLRRIVSPRAERMGLQPAGVYELSWFRANAFAFPLTRRLAFTDGAMAALGDDEIGAVTAHELGHLSESRITALARSAGVFIVLPLAAGRLLYAAFGAWALAAAFIFVLTLILALRRLARRMEERADAIASSQDDAGAYARALEAIYEANMIPAVLSGKRRVHPHLYDRLLAAGVQPAYERPGPPPRWPSVVAAAAAVLVVALLSLGLRVGLLTAGTLAREHEPALMALVAIDGGEAAELADLAELRASARDHEAAAALLEVAVALRPDEVFYAARLSILLSQAGQCIAARDYAGLAAHNLEHAAAEAHGRAWVQAAEGALDRCRTEK
jgi:Zn-dependent protease with chaperone function